VKSRPRIAYILTPITFGGSERVKLNYLKNADRDTFDIRPILLTRPWEEEPYFLKEIRRYQYSFETVPVAIRRWGDLLRGPRSFRLLYSLIKRDSCDLIHTHGYFADIMGVPISRMLGIPSLSTCHGFVNTDIKLRLYNRLDLLALRFSHRVLCVSGEIRNLLMRSGIPAHRIWMLPNAVEVKDDPEYFQRIRRKTRQLLGIMEDEILLGYCGRLSKEKGLRYLIEASGALVMSGLPIKVLLIGDGPEKKEIESLAMADCLQNKVLLTGFREDVLDIMPSIDIFVLPSLTEGTPMALLEAMAQGIPVVVSAVGEIPAIVNQGQNGILVNPGQWDDIVKAVRKISEDEELRRKLSHNAAETVSRKFGLKPWIRQIEAHYTALIDSGNRVG